jgi:hypothetical protein
MFNSICLQAGEETSPLPWQKIFESFACAIAPTNRLAVDCGNVVTIEMIVTIVETQDLASLRPYDPTTFHHS